jgi:hypothetical protein
LEDSEPKGIAMIGLLRFQIAVAFAFWFSFIPAPASAQGGGLHVRFGFDGTVDCDQPQKVKDFPIHGAGTGVMYPDRRASLDLSVRASTTNRIHFDATLGGAPTSAPGGTAQLRVASASTLRMVWDLPNSNFVVNLTATKASCSVRIDTQLKRGSRQYTLFDGGRFFFCSKPQIVQTSCQVK